MTQDPSLQWDVFCRVIDNHGDLGVCLRLARHLTARGDRVRLWVDDAKALAWMANGPEEHLWVHPWPTHVWSPPTAHQVVLETFGCHLPSCVERELGKSPPLAWINLEYLSAEPWVERAHGLPSPVMSGPAKGLSKRFCYPGFTARTGGLLTQSSHEERLPNEGNVTLEPAPQRNVPRQVSLFCYPHAPLAALFQRLADRPTQVWVAGSADLQRAALESWRQLPKHQQSLLQLQSLTWMNQSAYDALLQRCDLNVVRGEDSFVRAQWAGRPWLWHIYPQSDGSHAIKLDAFLDRWLEGIDPGHVAAWRQTWRAWNGLTAPTCLANNRADGLDEDGLTHARAWRDRLRRLPDLASTLRAWARDNPSNVIATR